MARRAPAANVEATLQGCLAAAERLAASGDATARWVGRDALKDLKRLA